MGNQPDKDGKTADADLDILGKPVKKEAEKLSGEHKSLIKDVWENSKHGDIGARIYTRLFYRRPDFKRMFDQIGKDAFEAESRVFTTFLEDVISTKLDDIPALEAASQALGNDFIRLKEHGFRPEYLVQISEAMTSECMYLDDQGSHGISDSTAAWSSLVSLIVANIREGYYSGLRVIRRSSKRLAHSASIASGGSGEGETSPVSPPPLADLPEGIVGRHFGQVRSVGISSPVEVENLPVGERRTWAPTAGTYRVDVNTQRKRSIKGQSPVE